MKLVTKAKTKRRLLSKSCETAQPRTLRHLLAGMLALYLPLALNLPLAQAGFGFKEVWFPDGEIRWFPESTPGLSPFLTATEVSSIRVTMAYMSERLPLAITEVSSSAQSNLMFKKSMWNGAAALLPVGGAWTFGYWNPDGIPKDISYFTSGSVGRGTTAHEFGHALGMPHEHQRADAQSLLTICPGPDWANMGEFSANVRYHSPFDVTSQMIYRNDCVTVNSTEDEAPWPRFNGSMALYSPHDINSIYRVYGRRLGADHAHEMFGHATAVFDLDADGFEDIVVAANEVSSNTRRLNLYFFRGVQTDPSENDSGRKYMPWFRHMVASDFPDTPTSRLHRLTLAPGDFDGDGRVELAVGYPKKNTERRVRIYGQSPAAAFLTGRGSEPWGVKGLNVLQDISPSDIDPDYNGKETFAQALHVGRLRSASRDDLVIGWPTANKRSFPPSSPGVVVHLANQAGAMDLLDASSAVITTNPGPAISAPIDQPAPPGPDFGSAITVLLGSRYGNGLLDTLVVGAPGENFNQGHVYIYGISGRRGPPSLLSTLKGEANSRFGHALASIYVAGPIIQNTNFSIIVGAPEEASVVDANSVAAGAVYHYRISGRSVSLLGRFTSPPHRLAADMQWGFAVAVIEDGSGYDGVQVGIGAPGASSGTGLVYAWHPFTSTGVFSTSGASLTAPSDISRRYGEVLRPIAINTGHHGFAISSPMGISSETTSGFVQVRINQNALNEETWDSDRQILSQSITGDHLPENIGN